MEDRDTSKKQIDKFREAAREAETDDSESSFDKIVKRIAKVPLPQDKRSPREKG